MTDELRVDCPSCKVPGQPVGLHCGFCSEYIPAPAGGILHTQRIDDGFKGFTLRDVGSSAIRLWSPSFPMEWQPHEWMVAECATHGWNAYSTQTGGLNPTHPDFHGSLASDPTMVTPVKACGGTHGHGCGFYCARGRNHLLSALPEYVMYSPQSPKVIARVECAGKIILASNGYRAQKMRPLEIFVPHEFWKVGRDLKAAYGGAYEDGVECVVTTAATMLAAKELKWCEKCRSKLKARSTTCSICGHTHQ